MNRKTLEEMGLTKEQVDQIMKENGESIESAKTKMQEQIDEITKDRDGYKSQLADRDKQLDTLKKNVKSTEELTAKVTELQEANKAAAKAHEAEIKELRVNAAVDKALTEAGAKNGKAVRALLDLTKAELDEEGSVKGLGDQLKALQKAEDSAFLFNTKPQLHIKGAQPGASPDGVPGAASLTKDQITKMSYKDLAALKASDPEGFESAMSGGSSGE